MTTLAPFCFCTNNVPGSRLEPALELAARCGFTCVELSAIDGISEQIVAEEVCPAYVEQTRRLLDRFGLRCYAVSGHCDMTEEKSFRRLLKKIEFAGEIGASCLNTRCGPKSRWDIFQRNVREAAALAARYGMTLNLESYGDIVGPASECGEVFRALDLPNVGYNYDPGNTFRFARGEISIEDDLAHAEVRPAYLHLKDASLCGGWIRNDPIGQGQLRYPAILDELDRGRSTPLPTGLEIPLTFRVRASDLSFDFLSPTLDQVEDAVRVSLRYIRSHARVLMDPPG